MDLLLTFLIGLAGGTLLFRLKVPGGMMVGAIVAVAALSIAAGRATMPSEAKLAAQSLAGAFIACGVDNKDIRELPKLWKPLLSVIVSLLVVNLLLGFLITLCSPLDLTTALMSTMPGGMSDAPIIAADMGADASKVAILQFVRMSTGIGLFPMLILWVTKHEQESGSDDAAGKQSAGGKQKGMPVFLLTLAVAFAFGLFGKRLGIPAGTLLFSMLGVMVLKLLWGKAYLPMWAKRLAQVLSGSYIGCGITRNDVLELRYLLLPALLILVVYFLNSLATGYLLHRAFGYSRKTGMLMATPAGASDMALISADLGVTDRAVVELQITRMVIVIAVFPQVIALVSNLFS